MDANASSGNSLTRRILEYKGGIISTPMLHIYDRNTFPSERVCRRLDIDKLFYCCRNNENMWVKLIYVVFNFIN